MKLITDMSKKYQCLAILIFFASGAGSVYLFYQVPSLWFLQGISEYAFRTAVTLAWVMIIPVWIVFFLIGMAFLEAILHFLDPKT